MNTVFHLIKLEGSVITEPSNIFLNELGLEASPYEDNEISYVMEKFDSATTRWEWLYWVHARDLMLCINMFLSNNTEGGLRDLIKFFQKDHLKAYAINKDNYVSLTVHDQWWVTQGRFKYPTLADMIRYLWDEIKLYGGKLK